MAQRKALIRPQTTQLGQNYSEAAKTGGGIVPNAHPELAAGPQIANPFKMIGQLFKKKNVTGSTMSPSTTHDH